jgi:hypothetical protein
MYSAFGVDHGEGISKLSQETKAGILGPIYTAGAAKQGKGGAAYRTQYGHGLAGAAVGGGAGAGIGALAGRAAGKGKAGLGAAIGGGALSAVGSFHGNKAGYKAAKKKGYLREGS